MALSPAATATPASILRLDKLGVLVALIGVVGLTTPFALYRGTRIAAAEPRAIFAALPPIEAWLIAALVVAGLVIALLKTPTIVRLIVSFVILAALLLAVGHSADFLTPPDNTFARVSPGTGFWVMSFAFTLMTADALTRMHLGPWSRIGILALVVLAVGAIFIIGTLNNVSVMREYAVNAAKFWIEGRTHILLAFGSLVAAIVVGVPLGIVCYKQPKLRATVLNVLNIVQTIPSIALFGLLIAPLAWVAATIPGARAIGISGIGPAPAMVALFAYSLLPVVANTVVGLLGVPEAANDAARGMGMTDRQRLFSVELPLAFPVILTGIRIVLVQNIGLATIAALIGGGGWGYFVFLGISQTAMDLVLLGAVPTVALAFAAAIILDAIVDMVSARGRGA